MTMNNQERAVATIVGECHALFMALQVMAKHHPAPHAVMAEWADATQHGLATLEQTTVPEAAIEAFQHVAEGIQKALEANQKYTR